MHDPAQLPEVPPSERITVTNEVELEEARLRSVPPPGEFPAESGSLSLLNDEMHVRFVHRDLRRAKLIARYVASIGSLEQVPVLVASLAELVGRALDPRAAFVVAQIDGHTSLDTILDLSGMSVLETLRTVCELVRRKIIAFPPTPHA
jgi:hypothetical protein